MAKKHPVIEFVGKVVVGAIVLPFFGLLYCYNTIQKGKWKLRRARNSRRQRNRVKNRRLPKAKPLVGGSPCKPPGRQAASSTTSPFLALPVEIRLQIYRLAFEEPAILQISDWSAFRGPRPAKWRPGQMLRDDADEPSLALRNIIGLGGSGLNQLVAPPSHGCVRYGCLSPMIYVGGQFLNKYGIPENQKLFWGDVLQTCRVIYDEVLDVLYADNTFSLFGPEIARYFCRNASPEGLQRIRYMHLALPVSSSDWNSKEQRKNVETTFKMLRDSMPSLQQFDVEVVVLWGQPADLDRFWSWLKNDLLGRFRGLNKFVLKVVVYKPFTPPIYSGYDGWAPEIEELEGWDDDEYRKLKDEVMSKDGALI